MIKKYTKDDWGLIISISFFLSLSIREFNDLLQPLRLIPWSLLFCLYNSMVLIFSTSLRSRLKTDTGDNSSHSMKHIIIISSIIFFSIEYVIFGL